MGGPPAPSAGSAIAFRRKDGTAEEVVRAAPNLSRSPGSGMPEPASGVAAVPLSPLDEALFVRPLIIPWAFFFKEQLEAPRLKMALSLALHKFPLLAGRISPCRLKTSRANAPAAAAAYEFVLTNEGITFDEFTCSVKAEDCAFFAKSAQSDLLEKLSDPVDNQTPPMFCPKLDAKRVWDGREPLLRVRLTTLAGGSGCIVGITASHIAVDGASLVAFLQYWARKCQDLACAQSSGLIFSPGRIPPESPLNRAGPSFDREELRKAVVDGARPPPFVPEKVTGGAAAPAVESSLADAATGQSEGSSASDEEALRAVSAGGAACRDGGSSSVAAANGGGIDAGGPDAGAGAAHPPGADDSPLAGRFPWFKAVKKLARVVGDIYLGKQASVVLRVTGDEALRLKAAASKGLQPEEFVSTNDVLMAYMWALARAAREKKGKDSTVVPGRCIMFQTINLRRHLPELSASVRKARRQREQQWDGGSSLLLDYFGNCSWAIPAFAPPSASLEALPKHVRDGVVAATAPSGKAATLVEGVFGHAAPVTEGDGNSRQGASGSDQIKRALAPVFADCMVSSLSFDGAFWLLDFGAGKPFWFWGGIFPLAPWGFALVQEPPNLPLAASSPLPLQPAAAAGGGGGGFLIFSAVPSRHANKMRALAESVLKDFLRNDSDDQDRNLQQGD